MTRRGAVAAALAAVSSLAVAESPQSFALELRLGMYHPRIDSSADVQLAHLPGTDPGDAWQGPYGFAFGDRGFLLFELELDWQIVRLLGTLSLGGAAGYFGAAGNGRYSAEEGSGLAGETSPDKTMLVLLPLRLTAVWRMDEFARRWGVPFVPYAKFGYGPTLWWATDGRGSVSWANGDRGAGARWGYEAAFGLMFLLDFLDPSLALDFDVGWGVNHTYVFGEFRINRVGTLGTPGLILSDDMLAFGLAFEF